MKEHKEKREQIENDTWNKIDALKDKNKEELAKIIDMGMEAKCNLTLINNNFNNKKKEKESKEKEIQKKQNELNQLYKTTNNLK